jgi:hypothetical protein
MIGTLVERAFGDINYKKIVEKREKGKHKLQALGGE